MNLSIVLVLAAGLCLNTLSWVAAPTPRQKQTLKNEVAIAPKFHDFKVNTLMGDSYDFASLKGKRVLIVNTASACGYTPQYKQLQELYEMYGGENFEIIGFPSNDFGKQEPGSNAEIATFCEKNFGVSFPMMTKIVVKGKEQHPVYQWLTQKAQNGMEDNPVRWNFNKFLINEKGEWVAYFGSKTSPMDAAIVNFAKG